MIRKILGGAAAALILIGAAQAAHHEKTVDEAKALEIYETIIAMRTAKGHGAVPAMAAYLAVQLKSAGFTDDDIQIMPKAETAALVVRFRGDGSSEAKPILFLGHMDVVDANPDDWELDPFTLTEQDGYFFGRGTSDNKYGIMNLTQTFMRLKRDGFTPTRDLYLAFSGDEETGMSTTKMLAYEVAELSEAEFALNADAGGGSVGEDGRVLGYGVQAAEKTYATFEVTARNQGGHSSRPRTDNAIYDLVDALKNIEDHKFPVMANDITRASFAGMGATLGGDIGKAMQDFAENPKNKKAARILSENSAYVGMTRTTCVATMLAAGHAENALPQSATATVNCRIFPGVSVDDVKTTLIDVMDNEALEIDVLDEPVESPVSEMRDDVTAALSKAVHGRYPGIGIGPYQESGGTDGMHFRRAGIPTLAMSGVFMKQSDMFAHGLNERIPVKAFYDGLDHWMIIITELAGPAKAKSGE